jgi:hypothetical protein
MKPLPLPVRVAAGLAVIAIDQAKHLPEKLAELPVTVVSQALQFSMRVQQQVTELAIKGDDALASFRPVEETPEWATFDEDAAEESGFGPDLPAQRTSTRSRFDRVVDLAEHRADSRRASTLRDEDRVNDGRKADEDPNLVPGADGRQSSDGRTAENGAAHIADSDDTESGQPTSTSSRHSEPANTSTERGQPTDVEQSSATGQDAPEGGLSRQEGSPGEVRAAAAAHLGETRQNATSSLGEPLVDTSRQDGARPDEPPHGGAEQGAAEQAEPGQAGSQPAGQAKPEHSGSPHGGAERGAAKQAGPEQGGSKENGARPNGAEQHQGQRGGSKQGGSQQGVSRRGTEGPGVLPGYPELSLPQLRARLRKLTIPELQQLVDYERLHENRPEFVGMLTRRITTLRTQR